jgi:hypothetical protein
MNIRTSIRVFYDASPPDKTLNRLLRKALTITFDERAMKRSADARPMTRRLPWRDVSSDILPAVSIGIVVGCLLSALVILFFGSPLSSKAWLSSRDALVLYLLVPATIGIIAILGSLGVDGHFEGFFRGLRQYCWESNDYRNFAKKRDEMVSILEQRIHMEYENPSRALSILRGGILLLDQSDEMALFLQALMDNHLKHSAGRILLRQENHRKAEEQLKGWYVEKTHAMRRRMHHDHDDAREFGLSDVWNLESYFAKPIITVKDQKDANNAFPQISRIGEKLLSALQQSLAAFEAKEGAAEQAVSVAS